MSINLNVNSFGNIGAQNSNLANQYVENNKAEDFQSLLEKAKNSDTEDEVLQEACKEFESYFLQTVMKEMRKTIPENDQFIKKGQGEKIFTDLLDQQYAEMSAEQNTVGLANMLYKQMSHKGKEIVKAEDLATYNFNKTSNNIDEEE